MPKLVNTVYTIGHSTRTIEDFIKLIKTYGIEMVVDVRTIAGSDHNPQYNEESLSKSLSKHNISYMRMKELGGLRHATKLSLNNAWNNPSFRGYADYMQTAEFTESIKQLITLAKEKQIAIMCAEAVPWRCHRSLIGDALIVRNIEVVDIMSEKSSKPHNTICTCSRRYHYLSKNCRKCNKNMNIQKGDCVKIADGRIARVREVEKNGYKVRVRRKTSKSYSINTRGVFDKRETVDVQ